MAASLIFTFSDGGDSERARPFPMITGSFPGTWVWVLQLLLEPGKGRAKGLRVLQKHFVHDQDGFLSNVGLSVGHLWRGQEFRLQCKKTPQSCYNNVMWGTKLVLSEGAKPSLWLTSVMMSLARSRAKSGVTKQERPVRATPVSYMLGLLRSWDLKQKKEIRKSEQVWETLKRV